tara:strand:- start:73 stop:453 length:381 start_codon:yes stop_codon:yes gene_type:complete
MQRKCKICIKNFEINVTLTSTSTAQKIWENLPIVSNANVWGEEVYFYVSVSSKREHDAREVVNFGDIAFWPSGKAIAIGFGRTPVSKGDEIRLADKCNIWGKTDFDLKKLIEIKSGEKVVIEKCEL